MKTPTKTALSKALRCSRSTLHTWEAAGCPVNDIESAQRWVAVNGVGSDASLPAALRRQIGEERLRILEQTRIRMDRENAIEAGNLVPIEQAAALFGAKLGAIAQQLDSIPALVPGLTLAQRGILVSKIETIKDAARAARDLQ